MAYSKQTWVDADQSKPLSAARLNHMEDGIYSATTRVAYEAPINVLDPPGSLSPVVVDQDSTTQFAAMVAALPSTGGEIYVPPVSGNYLLSNLSLFDKDGITIKGGGAGGVLAGGYGSKVVFTGGATFDRLLDARQTRGLRLRDLQLIYNSSAFVGTAFDFANDSGTGANDTLGFECENVWFGGQPSTGGINAASIVGLENAHTGSFQGCNFMRGQVGVQGRAQLSDYCNTMVFQNCLFQDNYVSHLKNAGGSWLFSGCTFEDLVSDFPGAYKQSLASNTNGPVGLTFLGCWFGDVTSDSSGKGWIEWEGNGLAVIGCAMSSEHANSKHIILTANNCKGVVVMGNMFLGPGTPAVDLGATTGHKGLMIGPNSYQAGVAVSAGTLPSGSVVWDANGFIGNDPLELSGALATNSGEAHQLHLHHIAGAPAVIFGSAADASLSRTNTGQIALKNTLNFPVAVTAASCDNNTLFRSSADNKLHFKDNGGVDNALY